MSLCYDSTRRDPPRDIHMDRWMDGMEWNGMEWNGMGWDGWKENHISSTYFFFNYHDHFPFPHLSIYLSTPSYYTLPYPTLSIYPLVLPTLP